jgi:acetoacetyl-CoA synthetase
VRIGTAEIYRQVEQMPEILESVVVGLEVHEESGPDVRIVLFVRAAEGAVVDDVVQDRLRRRLREQASPHHVPKIIRVVQDIPRTVSGKISEIAVREALHGRPVKNTGALANPASVAEFVALGEVLRR